MHSVSILWMSIQALVGASVPLKARQPGTQEIWSIIDNDVTGESGNETAQAQ